MGCRRRAEVRIRLVLVLVFIVCSSWIADATSASPQIVIKKRSVRSLHEQGYGSSKALNTDTGNTLVIWREDYIGVVGQLISRTGRFQGKPFVIAKSSGKDDNFCCVWGSSITYNPITAEYFVAYSWFDTGSILGVRLDSNAKVIGKEITLVAASSSPFNAYPRVIFNPKTNGYVLIWDRTEGIVAALLDSSGKMNSPIVIVKKNPGSNGFYDDFQTNNSSNTDKHDPFNWRIFDVEWLGAAKKLLILFQQRFSADEADLWLAKLDPLLKRRPKVSKVSTTPIDLKASAWGYWRGSLASLPDGTACVFYADQEKVKERTISSRGKLSSPPFAAFSGVIDEPLYDPAVTFSSTSSGTIGLLVAYVIIPFGVSGQNSWAQVLDEHGLAIGEAKIIDTLVSAQPITSALMALPRKPSDTQFEFVWLQSRVDPAPPKLLKLKLQVLLKNRR